MSDERPDPPVSGDEAAMLLGFLARQRATLAWKCGGLDAAAMRRTAAASTITLGGLVKHLANVEDDMAYRWVHGRPLPPPWDAAPDEDWAWRSAADETPEQVFATWRASCERADAVYAEALAAGGVDTRATGVSNKAGEHPDLRYVLVTLIEEYARHVGHADLIRESIDGLVGE